MPAFDCADCGEMFESEVSPGAARTIAGRTLRDADYPVETTCPACALLDSEFGCDHSRAYALGRAVERIVRRQAGSPEEVGRLVLRAAARVGIRAEGKASA